MAKAKSTQQSSEPEFVEEGEAAQEKGYWGTRDNDEDDEAFALTTGPDAPLQDSQGNTLDIDEHIQKGSPGAEPETQSSTPAKSSSSNG